MAAAPPSPRGGTLRAHSFGKKNPISPPNAPAIKPATRPSRRGYESGESSSEALENKNIPMAAGSPKIRAPSFQWVPPPARPAGARCRRQGGPGAQRAAWGPPLQQSPSTRRESASQTRGSHGAPFSDNGFCEAKRWSIGISAARIQPRPYGRGSAGGVWHVSPANPAEFFGMAIALPVPCLRAPPRWRRPTARQE